MSEKASTSALPIQRVSARPDTLVVEWTGGAVCEFASLWLRDNQPEHRDPHSGQRLVDVADLPARPRIRAALLESGSVRIDWEDDAPAARFDARWLWEFAPAGTFARDTSATPFPPRPWLEGARLTAKDFAWIEFERASQDAPARSTWLARLLCDGMAFLRAVPARDSAILEAMRLVGRICETNYGQVFDVKSVPQPENLAYSDLGLGLHTDNPYREPVPGFQALHGLVTSNEGGDSLFADGFALAEHLRTSNPEAFNILSSTAVPFHYRSRNAELHAERPLIQLTCDGRVAAVHYNGRSIAPLRLDAAAAAPARTHPILICEVSAAPARLLSDA